MLVLYKRWKFHNEIQYTKRTELEQSIINNNPPSPKRGVKSRDWDQTVEATGYEIITT